ncbi:MAG: methyltransferase domain-containing protein [Bacteroidota bacterium]
MIQQELLQKLVDPVSRTALALDEDQQQLKNQDRTYAIRDRIPLLLPQQAEDLELTSAKHDDLQSTFKYVEHYQRDAQHFDYFQSPTDGATLHENRRLHETIISEIPDHANSILDVGCGSAWVAQHFCPRGKSVCSFDISLENTSKALAAHPYPTHNAVVGDVYHLPFKTESFDAIISAEVIEHVADPATYLEKLIRVLKKDGVLVISTPYKEYIPHYLCIHCNKPTPQHAHLHSFDENRILSLVPKHENFYKIAYACSNKYLAKLRTHILLKYLPFRMWRMVDKMANAIVQKQQRLILKIVKK